MEAETKGRVVVHVLTFGIKTRHRVIVVQKMMKRQMMMNDELGRSLMMNDTAPPHTHMMTTLYTLIPMYLESFRAGMLTWRVSHAKKHPNT